MTFVPPSADDVLSPLRAQLTALVTQMQLPEAEADEGVQLKQRIFLLHRAVEQHAQVIEQLQADVKGLVAGWKGRFAPQAPTAVAGAEAAVRQTPQASERVAQATPMSAATSTDPFGMAPVRGQPRVIDELNASTFVEKGWSRIATGDFTGAEESLYHALELNPTDANAEALLGWAQMAQGKYDAALAVLQQVLDRIPDHALAHVNLGYIHLRRGMLDRASEHLEHALALDSDRKATLYAHFYLGMVRFEEERFAEAIGALLRAIELGPNLVEARYELGRVFWFSERTDDALAAWRKGADVNKFNPWSARCREMLATIADGGAPARTR